MDHCALWIIHARYCYLSVAFNIKNCSCYKCIADRYAAFHILDGFAFISMHTPSLLIVKIPLTVLSLYTHAHTSFTHTHTTALLLFWNLSGTTRVSRYRKGKPGRVKPIWIYWSKRQWVAVASAGLYATLTPFNLLQGLPLRATHGFTSHSTHPQSSSLHGTVKAGSLSDIEKRALPPPCFPSFNFQSARSQGATLALLLPVLT